MRSYADTYRQDSVLSLTPEQILLRLFDVFLQRLDQAEYCLEKGDLAGMGTSVSRAVAIVNALQDALDPSLETDVVAQLDRLYHTVRGWLIQGNIHHELGQIQSSRRVMHLLKEGFEGAVSQVG